MFDAEGARDLIGAGNAGETGEPLEDVVWQSDLPDVVRAAPRTYAVTRLMNDAEIERLTNEQLNIDRCPHTAERLKRRRKALNRVRGKEITCSVVRLPGAIYTLEIDTDTRQVVHWEWQAT